jgi:hypothetical protein
MASMRLTVRENVVIGRRTTRPSHLSSIGKFASLPNGQDSKPAIPPIGSPEDSNSKPAIVHIGSRPGRRSQFEPQATVIELNI